MGDADEFLQTLLGRVHYLDFLQETAENKRNIIDEFETPRSTVDRDIRKLSEIGLVERTEDGYRTTTPGRLASSVYHAQQEKLSGIENAMALLRSVPVHAPLSPTPVRDARVIESTAYEPDRPTTHLLDLFDRARRVRVTSPFLLRSYVEAVHDQVTSGSTTAEMVLTTDAFDQLITTYEDRATALVDSDRFTLYEVESLPYGLFIATTDTWVECGLVVSDDTGIKGVIHSDEPAAVRWMESQYRSVRSRSARRG